MLKRHHILTILWLGILSSPLVYAGEACPQDSVLGRDENGDYISKVLYNYDEAGRTILEERWSKQDDILVGTSKYTKEFYQDGMTKSSAIWGWSTETNDWAGTSKKDYVYDAQGNIISQIEYTWSKELNNWIESTKDEKTYNAQGYVLTRSTFIWSNITNNWQNSERYEYTYDSSNRQVLILRFKGENQSWINYTKQEYNYDAAGHKILNRYWNDYNTSTSTWIGEHWYIEQYSGDYQILSEKYTWNTETNKWKGYSKTEYEYNSIGKPTLYIYYTWNDTANVFEGSSKSLYDYDQWKNTILTEQYQWKEGHWEGSYKGRNEYLQAGGNPIMTATFQWDSISASFIGVDSIRLAKDADGNQILDEQYNWQNNDWVGLKKEEMIYDDAKNIISKKTYQWLSTQWTYATKDSSAYDANKNKILEEHYTWDTTDNYWVGTGEKHVSEYTNNMETLQEVYIWSTEKRDWTYKSKIIKEYDGNKVILDEEYALKGDVLEGTKKEKYAYNTKGETVLTVKYTWLHDEVWQGTDSILANYNNNKQQTLDEQYTWATEGNYWKGKEKATYTFNANKQQTSSWVYSWDDSNRTWIYASRDTSSYDSRKNLTLDERYTWDTENSAWVGTLKKEYAYNAKGQQTMFAYYAWDEATSKFIGTQKEENEVDDEGRTILHASYTWNDTDWKGKSKDTYTYLSGDTQSSHISYSWTSNKWVENKKTEWTYTELGKVATETLSNWNSTWVYATKTENTYTADVLTAYIKSKWESGAWVNDTRWEQVDQNTERSYEWWNSEWSITQNTAKEYDSENRLIRELDENYSHGTQTSGSKTEYTYSGDLLTQKSAFTFETSWIETDRLSNSYDSENRLTNTTTYTRDGSSLVYVSKVDNEYVGKSVTTTSYIWDNTIPNWQGIEKDEKIYSNDLDYTSTKSEWRGGGWMGISKTGYTFYTDGREHSITDYIWSSSTWVYDFKTEYEYSGTKNIVTATYLWKVPEENGGTAEWVGQTKEGVYYDEYEDLTTATWTWKNKAWSPQTKSGISLYDDGRTKSQTSYKISGTGFVYTTRVEYEYGATAKDITTANYTWNGTSWTGISKSGEVWDGSKITTKISYTWLSEFDWQYNQKTEYSYGSHPSDLTTAIYSWDTTIPDWVGVSKSGVTYASSGKQASEFSYTWGTTAAGQSDWLPVTKTEWEYGSGKDNTKATYKGVDTAWVGVSKYEEKYTEHGDSLGFYNYTWKNNDWTYKNKQELKYNDHGDKIEHIVAQWKNNAWVNYTTSTKWDITYDDNDNILLSAHFKWNGKNNWIGTGTKYEYEYDSAGRKTKETQYDPSGTTWKYSNQNEWQYDDKDSLVMRSVLQYNSSSNKWSQGTKNEWQYNSLGLQTLSASYTWSSTLQKWMGTTKTEWVFDEGGNKTATISYSWDVDLSKWQEFEMYQYTYDEQGREIEQLVSTYNTTQQTWVYSTQNIYAYDSHNRLVESYKNTWKNGQWEPISKSIKKYDEDPYTRTRYTIEGTWSNGAVTFYEDIRYYYACDPKFQVEVKAEPEEGGSVTGDGEYILNGQAVLTAVPDSGCYTFKEWQDSIGQVVATTPTYKFLVNENNKGTYTAIFTPILRTIRGSVTGGGSVRVALKPND